MKLNAVRTRFAPSPTGYMHVGNLRTALYAYLVAKKNKGDFLLRIEDTDQERQVDGALTIIYDTLKETGLIWDEGPDIGGPVGPYIQSERMGMFREYADILLENGTAYYCFCDKECLEEVRTLQKASGMAPKYDGCCRRLSKDEIQAKLEANIPYVIRQKMPLDGSASFHDQVFGEISVENAGLDDQVLIKTDGMPTYNFANVIDDHLMGISHVIRGSEYLSSAPKYNLLYQAFGWDIPIYVHCSPVMKDATHKLSKRNGDASYQDLIKNGYLKDAVLNYIALLGWSPKGDQEKFTLLELIEEFDIAGISKSPAIFDIQKLNYMNGEYIKAMCVEEFHTIALPWIKQALKSEDVDTMLLAKILQPRTNVLSEIPEQIDFIDVLPAYSNELYVHKKMKTDEQIALTTLKVALPVLQSLNDYSIEAIHEALFGLVEQQGVKNGVILWPVRVAVSGKQFTPGGAVELCALLGKTQTVARIEKAIAQLS